MMKATVNAKTFRDALDKCCYVVERGHKSLPILSMIRFQVEKDVIVLTGTDLDINVVVRVPASGCLFGAAGKDKEGVCIPLQVLRFVRALPADAVLSLQISKDNRFVIDTADGSAAFMTLPGTDWPTWDKLDDETTISAFDPKVFHDGMTKALPFVSQEETRYYLCGVRFEFKDGGLTFVATDGNTMIKKLLDDPKDAYAAKHSCIVPRKAIQTFLKVFPRGGAGSMLQYGEKRIRFEHDDILVETKLIDGTYPDYQRVIPTPRNATSRYTIDRASWMNALKRMLLGKGACAITMGKTSDGRVYLQHKDPDIGAVVVAVKATPGMLETDQKWNDITIGFNARYLQRIFSTYDDETVQMLMTGEGAPTLFIGNHTTTVLMPMRVTEDRRILLPEGARAA